MGKVHGSITRAGKVRNKTPPISKTEKVLIKYSFLLASKNHRSCSKTTTIRTPINRRTRKPTSSTTISFLISSPYWSVPFDSVITTVFYIKAVFYFTLKFSFSSLHTYWYSSYSYRITPYWSHRRGLSILWIFPQPFCPLSFSVSFEHHDFELTRLFWLNQSLFFWFSHIGIPDFSIWIQIRPTIHIRKRFQISVLLTVGFPWTK